MKKFLVFLIVGLLTAAVFTMDIAEAKKGKGKGITADDIQQMSETIDGLTRKIYGHTLFSSTDNENLIGIKLKLDNQMLVAPDVTLAPLYYKLGIIYKAREMKDESIESFQTILENFADTALAPKAAAQLKSMGVVVAAPEKKEDSGE